ncbi:hypothetical protein HDU76_011018, partial [Blyttiomyces sp. JEL0837]
MSKGKDVAVVESQLSEMTLVESGDDAGGVGSEFEKSEQRNVMEKELVIEYEPAEESFLSSVRWILSFAHSDHGNLQISDNIKSEVKRLQDSMSEKKHGCLSRVIPTLCHGALYQVAVSKVFQSSKPNVPISIIPDGMPTDEHFKRNDHFTNILMENGYLDFHDSLRDSIRDMVMDVDPFYESIHSSIIEAIMTASIHTTVNDVIEFGRITLSQTPKPSEHPYDLEEAFLWWINTLAESSLSKTPTITSTGLPPYFLHKWKSLKNFTSDFRDGKAFCLLFHYYFPGCLNPDLVHPRVPGTFRLSRRHRIENLMMVKEAVRKVDVEELRDVFPWEVCEFAGVDRDGDKMGKKGGGDEDEDLLERFSGSFRVVLVCVLERLFRFFQ